MGPTRPESRDALPDDATRRRPPEAARASAAAFLLLASLLLLTWPGWRAIYDTEAMFRVTESLLSGGLRIVDPGTEQRAWGIYGIGQSLVFLPFVLPSGALASLLGQPVSDVARTCASLANTATGAATGALVVHAALGAGLAARRALLVGLLTVLGTPLWPLSQQQYAEPAAALALTLAVLLCARRERLVLAGAAAGFAVLTKPALLVAAPLAVVAALVPRRREGERRRLAAFAAGLLPLVALHLAYSVLRFGELLPRTYPGSGQGFSTPLSTGVAGLLWGPSVGLAIYGPVVLLALLLLPLARHRAPGLALAAGLIFGADLLLHARWSCWWGNGPWGSRFLAMAAPPLLAALAFAWAERPALGLLVLPAGLLSVAANLVGVMHPPDHTWRKVQGSPEAFLLLEQLRRIGPWDLDFAAFRATAGTYWPTLTLFGSALVCTGIGALALYARALGGSAARAAAGALLPLLLLGLVRDRMLPYRIVDEEISSPLAAPVPLDRATFHANARPRESRLPAALPGRSRIVATTYMRRGLYRFEVEVEGGSPDERGFSVRLAFGTETLALERLGPRERRTLVSRVVRVQRRGSYALALSFDPEVEGRGGSHVLTCRSFRIVSGSS